MRAIASAAFVLPQLDPTDMVVDLFCLDDTPLLSLENRPHSDDLDTIRQKAGMIKDKKLELTRLRSMQNEKAR